MSDYTEHLISMAGGDGDKLGDIAEAFTMMTEALDRVQASFRRMTLQLELLHGRSKKLGRRLERAARRPALIHKGGRPRA